ncbi:ankyrin repeat-containing domain protein, partial [Flagelloscypha sp. PMI_526]
AVCLSRVARLGQTDLVDLLIQRGANVNRLDNWLETPLHDAIAEGHLEVVQLLVEHGAELSLGRRTALTFACMLGENQIAEFLLQQPG